MDPVTYPSQEHWQQSFGAGLAAAQEGLTTSPAIGDLTKVLGQVIEDATGEPLGAAVSDVAANLAAKLTRQFMGGGKLELSGELAAQLGQVVSAVAGVIPIFAQAWDMGQQVLAAAEAAQQARLKKLTMGALNRCKEAYRSPRGTGVGGVVTPADLFRPIYQAWKRGPYSVEYMGIHNEYPYPLSAASLFCALLGDQSPLRWGQHRVKIWTPPPPGDAAGGATVEERIIHGGGWQGYAAFLTEQRKRRASLGIPLETRQRLALVVRGIMASVRPWTLEHIEPVGDQGRALFPILCDALLQEFRNGRWDLDFLRALQRSQIGCLDVTNYQTGESISPVVDLSADFLGLIGAWKNTIESASADYGPAVKEYMSIPTARRGARAAMLHGFSFSTLRPTRPTRATLTPPSRAGRVLGALAGGALFTAILRALYRRARRR